MARKRKGIADFDSVAMDRDENINSDRDKDNAVDLKERLKRGLEKEDTTVFRGYYIDDDVSKAIDTMSEGREKGYKSFLVNEILKEYFRKNKWL